MSQMTANYINQSADFKAFKTHKKAEANLKQAQIKSGNVFWGHFFGGPIASFYYANKTSNWVPTMVASGVAIVTLPMAVIDAGFTFCIAPAVVSGAMLINKANSKREELGIVMPEEAVYKLERGDF